jgi:hypothetical protein
VAESVPLVLEAEELLVLPLEIVEEAVLLLIMLVVVGPAEEDVWLFELLILNRSEYCSIDDPSTLMCRP